MPGLGEWRNCRAERLTLAKELGATPTVDTSGTDLAPALDEITGGQGADGVVETTGNVGVLRQGVDALAARGTLVVVGPSARRSPSMSTASSAASVSSASPSATASRRP